MKKLKISDLFKETGAFILSYSTGRLFTKEGAQIKNEEQQERFSDLLNSFEEKKRMFEYLSDAKKHLSSPKPSVGFFIREGDDNKILVTRLYFIVGISMEMVDMNEIDYKKFFDEFIDLEGRDIEIVNPSS